MKKPETKKTETKAMETIKIDSYKVLRAVVVGENNNVLFDLELNGVRIYGLSVVEGKNGDFISFPQRNGKDGKYYSIAWAKISEEDTKDIIEEVETMLNN